MENSKIPMWQQVASTTLSDNKCLVEKIVGYEHDVLTNTKGDPVAGVLYKTIDNPIAHQKGIDEDLKDALLQIRSKKRTLSIALDTEYYTPLNATKRQILAWQFCFAHPLDPSKLEVVVFYSMNGKRLRLNKALAYIIEKFNLADELHKLDETKCPKRGFTYESTKEWKLPTYNTEGRLWLDKLQRRDDWVDCKTFDEAMATSKNDPAFCAAYDELAHTKRPSAHKLKVDPSTGHELELAGFINNFNKFHVDKNYLDVTLLCHAGKADLGTFDISPSDEDDTLRYCSEVQGGLITLNSYRANCRSNFCSKRFYPLHITVRDTMCHAPNKMRHLEDLGNSIAVQKVELPDGYSKDDMEHFLKNDPVDFMLYATQDAIVTLGYASSLYGFNHKIPTTASAKAAQVMKQKICKYLGIDKKVFTENFTGDRRKQESLIFDRKSHKMKPLYSKDFVSDGARLINELARCCYKGGLNGCSKVGWIDFLTFDLDLCSAYPTAMCCVYDIDFTTDNPIAKEWHDEWAKLEDFDTPFDPAFFFVDQFEFPKDVLYPSIAVNVEGRLFTPRTLGGQAGVYCTTPEVYLALKLGAKVHICRGYKGVVRKDADGKPTRMLGHGVKSFVEARQVLKEKIENGNENYKVLEQLFKMMVNSIYGKTAQNIVEKMSYDAYYAEMVDIGASCITSPCHAAITTAIVRSVLNGAMNELHELGYETHSYTTDGIITNAPAEVVNDLDLYGMAGYLKEARAFLAGDETLWECKHQQDEYYNLTTRGNIAPNIGGVLAHNSYVSPFDPRTEEQDDRDYCLDVWLRRTGKCDCEQNIWTRFRKMADPEKREDFMVKQQTRYIAMDFDVKRKPLKDSIVTKHPVLKGVEYEVANFDTEPYETPEEEVWYHQKLKNRQDRDRALRTEKDLLEFFASVEQANEEQQKQRRVKDWDWSVIYTCVMGHRLGEWSIPAIKEIQDRDGYVNEICNFINKFNESKREFKASDWKNARKQNRSYQMLKLEDVAGKLFDMGVGITQEEENELVTMQNDIDDDLDDYCVLEDEEFDDFCDKLAEELGEEPDWTYAATEYCILLGVNVCEELAIAQGARWY